MTRSCREWKFCVKILTLVFIAKEYLCNELLALYNFGQLYVINMYYCKVIV